MHGVKVFLQKFFAKYGTIFIGVYFLSFFVFITFLGRTNVQTFPGDVRFGLGNSVIYLPFTSSLAAAVVFILMYQAYKMLKG